MAAISKSGRSGDSFAELLARFTTALTDTGFRMSDLLAPGLLEGDVRAGLATIEMEPAAELVTWFGWHDGATETDPPTWGRAKLAVWYPFSLKESMEDWQRQDKGQEVWQWRPAWLPIAHVGNSARLAVDCSPPQRTAATLRAVHPESGWFSDTDAPAVEGFGTAVTWWTVALEKGWIAYDAAAEEWDDNRWTEIPWDQRRTGLI